MEPEVTHFGGCHCGAVRFQVVAPAVLKVVICNCSICHMKQNKHFIVPKSKFTLCKGEDQLTTYTFNTHVAKHTFCRICGIQSFYTPRSNPDGVGITPHCLDSGTVKREDIESFDGQNWEMAMKERKDLVNRSKTD
ncbi:centromere protein V-like [Lineus longissimus]|uniref:centromere protein V-like n=1 Tax=Lineus longissimus TaxID=88925 RepID=UPI00315DB2C6